jgi:hypothetical protein
LPNPASVFCEEQAGKVEMRTDDAGNQYGICVFEDGSECDEWAFFRAECQPGKSDEEDSQAAQPAYINEEFGFSFNPPAGWAIEDKGDYLLFTRPGYKFFVGFQAAGEEAKPFRTGMPQGEFVDGGTSILLGQPIPGKSWSLREKNKVVSYVGGRLLMIVVMYLNVSNAEVAYGNPQSLDK